MAPNRKRSIAARKHWISKKAKKDADSSNWLRAVENYVVESQTSILDLTTLRLELHEVQSLLKFLRDSQVDELRLDYKNNKNGMKVIAPLLFETKIKKLELRRTNINIKDFLLLLDVLKDTQITELIVRLDGASKFNNDEANRCISHLQRSKLTNLDSNLFNHFPPFELSSLIRDYLNASITCLNLEFCTLISKTFNSLFLNLRHSSVTDLSLWGSLLPPEAWEELSQRLFETKIKKLDLSLSELKNNQLKILIKGLVKSKVTDLDLSNNILSNLNPLFTKLKETQIETLDLDFNPELGCEKFVYANCLRCSSLTSLSLTGCCLSDEAGEGLMESLRFSNVTKLGISENFVGSLTVKKFAENAKDINLIDLDISRNPLPLDALFSLGTCSRESKLTHIFVSWIDLKPLSRVDHLLSFLKQMERSSIHHFKMEFYEDIWSGPLAVCTNMIVDFYGFADFCGGGVHLESDVLKSVTRIKFTAVTNLVLSRMYITDEVAMILAESLKETQIRKLDLSDNLITSQGAKALALSFKDTNLVYLSLSGNKIENDGLESLAENAKDTFVSVIDVSGNPGERIRLVDTVLWQNKISVDRLVSDFKQIAPQSNNEFCFDQNIIDSNVTACLEKYLKFYKTVVDKPQAISVLLEEESFSFSREQISNLLYVEFPLQFSRFVACRIEADVTEHVAILEKAEEMGLTAVVESLLLNRPVYVLDEGQGILHPQVYKLLLKYKQPICNLAVEPRGVIKIIEYFTEHAKIKGAEDLINSLSSANVC